MKNNKDEAQLTMKEQHEAQRDEYLEYRRGMEKDGMKVPPFCKWVKLQTKLRNLRNK